MEGTRMTDEHRKLCDALRNTHPSRMMCREAADVIERLAALAQSDAEPPMGSMFPCTEATETDLHMMAQELAGKRTAQSDAEPDEDRPLGFRTNDVPDPYAEGPPDPYAEGPQPDAEPVDYIPIGGAGNGA
jgi:hypothetical protein